jgi:hypothetical protein
VPKDGKHSEEPLPTGTGDSSSPNIVAQKRHESLPHSVPITPPILGDREPRSKAHLDASSVDGTPLSPVKNINNVCDTRGLEDGNGNVEQRENIGCNTPPRSGQDDSIAVPNSEIGPPSEHPRTSGRCSKAADRTAPSHGEIVNDIGDCHGSSDNMANAQEYRSPTASLPCKDHGEPLDTSGNNRPHKRRRSNDRRPKTLSELPLSEARRASDRAAELQPLNPVIICTQPLSLGANSSACGSSPVRQICEKDRSSIIFTNDDLKTARGPRTRAMARAEASSQLAYGSNDSHLSCKAQSYSKAEDDLLRDLVQQGLSWHEIESIIFSLRFPERSLGSPQKRWSRVLRFTVPLSSSRCSRRKRIPKLNPGNL